MEAATAPETQAENVAFISRAVDFGVTVYGGSDEIRNARGEVTTPAIPGFIVHFEGGRLTTEQIRAQAADAGLGEEAVSDAIEVIRNLDNFNTAGFHGTYEEGKHPDEPRPTILEMNVEIAKAAAERDSDLLRELIQVEREGHNRTVVIQNAEANIAALAEAQAE